MRVYKRIIAKDARRKRAQKPHSAESSRRFIRQVVNAGRVVGDAHQREDLRKILLQQMRALYEASGEFSLVELKPFGGER